MLTKLLLTIGVIVAVVLIFRTRRPAPTQQPTQQTTASARPALSPTRLTAWILITVIVAITLAATAWQWFQTEEVMTVRVINSNTGDSVNYQVYRDAVGVRTFKTTDGRTITVAEVERMEISPVDR